MKENESVLSDESLEDYKQTPRSYLAYSSRSNTRVSTFQKSSSRSIFSSGCSSDPAVSSFPIASSFCCLPLLIEYLKKGEKVLPKKS